MSAQFQETYQEKMLPKETGKVSTTAKAAANTNAPAYTKALFTLGD
jgi:hypothetical protein